jgi:hypothetical protein
MRYVIYNKETTILARLKRTNFKTERAAKAALTRGLNDGKIANRDEWAIAESSDFFCNIEKKKVVQSLISGKEIEIAVNTPRSCDPSSELYWSM